MEFVFTYLSFRQFKKLEKNIQKRIDKKLRFYSSQKNPLYFAEPLNDFRYGNWRFRIGEYRVLFDIEQDKIVILKVGHRKDIYN